MTQGGAWVLSDTTNEDRERPEKAGSEEPPAFASGRCLFTMDALQDTAAGNICSADRATISLVSTI